MRAFPLVEFARLGPLGVLAAVSGYAEKRGSSGVPRGMARGAGRGRSAGVDVPDAEGEYGSVEGPALALVGKYDPATTRDDRRDAGPSSGVR